MGRHYRSPLLALAVLPLLAACQHPPSGSAGSVQTQPLSQALPVKRGDTALGHQAFLSGDFSVAKTAFSAALRKDPSDAHAALGLAEVHLALNEVQAARQIFQALETKAPSLAARVNQGLGLIALRAGRADQAAGLLGKSVQHDDSLWRAWLGLGQAHDRLKQPSAARRAFAAAERVAPARAPVLNDLGMSYVSQKQPERALEFFERALAMDPGYEIARGNIRIAKAMTGQYEDAISGASETQLPDVLNNVGYIAILNKDFQVADRYLRRAIDLSAVYHKAAIANLDLLARMAGEAAPARRTAEAGIADEAQVVLAPSASDPEPQTLEPAIETADIGAPSDAMDAVARAATQQASSAQQLEALSTPVVTSVKQNQAGTDEHLAVAPPTDRAFKWKNTPSEQISRSRTDTAIASDVIEKANQSADRTFKWTKPQNETPIETADIAPAEPIRPVASEPSERNFNWEAPSDPISVEHPAPVEIATPPASQSTKSAEPQPVETKELRAPLLVDGLGSGSSTDGRVVTVLPPSNTSADLDRRFD